MTTIDISTPADAGFWREALAWVGFRVAEFERGDDVARERADALASEPSVPFIHVQSDSAEAQHNHVR